MRIFGNVLLLAFSLMILFAVAAGAALLTVPDVRQLEKCFTTSMFQVHLCPGSANYVPLSQISPYVVHAIIVSEDGSFYAHEGFDWHEMQESLEQNLKTGHIRRGGSTLTQQLAKNVFLDKNKSYWRKLKEAYLAHGIEKHYAKNFILEKYLNVVEFGDGIYGVRPAALHYFQKTPLELNPLEAAYLAFLLPNPKGYSKNFRNGKLTPYMRKTVSTILHRMNAYGKLSNEAYATALAELPNFPWHGVSLDSFKGTSNLNLDAPANMPKLESIPDEELFEEMVKEGQGSDGTLSE